MQVTKVLACTLVMPQEVELAIAGRALPSRVFTLVRVISGSGTEGIGFCYGSTKAGHLVTMVIRDLLRHHVIGRDPHEVEAIWDIMFRDTLHSGRRGIVLRAMSALDIALWDLIGKEAGLPLYSLLGSYRKDTVPAYASGGYYQAGKTPEHLAKEVRSYADNGFKAVKIKVGLLSPEEDAVRVKACREAIGPHVQLFLDANNAWNDAATAIQAIRMFEEYNPGWIEEPVMPDAMVASAAVAAAVRTPVATGELEATRWGFEALLHYRAASILQPDAAVCGGITEWRKIANLAAAHSIPVAPHWFAELHVHLVAATPNAIWVEFFPDKAIFNFPRLLKSSLEMRNGDLVLPKGPGLGIELDNKAVERYSTDGWQ